MPSIADAHETPFPYARDVRKPVVLHPGMRHPWINNRDLAEK